MNKDTLHVLMSDTHSGSNRALFLPDKWEGQNTSHYPMSAQVRIREHFIRFAGEVKQARKGIKVKLIIDGDAIEGDHHDTNAICTKDPIEMAQIHIDIMTEFQKRIDWQRGDEIHYVKGTEIHTGDMENRIGKEMNAVMKDGNYASDFLELDTNGVISWFAHHGPPAGEGANEGNSVANWLKRIYFNALKDERKIPDIIYTGHVHNPTYSLFAWRKGMTFKTMHGIILPAWQEKTRHGYKVAPVALNKIGGVYQLITASGLVGTPRFCVMGYD